MTLLSGAYQRQNGVQVVVSGARGPSDYQLWLLQGNQGSYEDFLDSQAQRVIDFAPGFKGDKGDPGANVMAIGRFADAGGIAIPGGTDLVQTSGYNTAGIGAALYAYDPTVTAQEAADNPYTTFRSTNGRGFRLAETDWTVDMFGAKGDGIADDALAIQRALDAIKKRATATDGQTRAGTLIFTSGRRYKCGSTITIDRAFHNVYGAAVLDFSSWTGTYIHLTGSYTEFGNGYGQNGCLEGQLVVVGSRKYDQAGNQLEPGGIGIKYDTPLVGSATHIRTVGVTVVSCDVAFQIGDRGYNQEFYNCKAFICGTIFDWLGTGDDNDERISVFGGTFYNSDLFVRHTRPAGGMYVYSASIDYTAKLAQIVSGKLQFFGVHCESSRWVPYPIDVSGNGGLFYMQGGWFLQQANTGGITHYVNVAAGNTVKFNNVITNNTNNVLRPDVNTPATWATGAGRFEMTGTEPAFQFADVPNRLHSDRSLLSNGDFENDLSQDMIWLTSDTQPITNRLTGHDIQISRVNANQLAGSACLRVDKQFGTTAPGAFVLMCVPVRPGDKVGAGFNVRTAPDRPGSNQHLIITGAWAKLDGADANNIPRIVRTEAPGDIQLDPPTDRYTMVELPSDTNQRIAPTWATHFIVIVDMVVGFQASWLFDRIWCDRF